MVDTRKNTEEISRMKKAFEIFDADGDGTITTKVIFSIPFEQPIEQKSFSGLNKHT